MTYEWFKGLKVLLNFEVDKKDVLGPVGIAKISGSSLDRGFVSVIFFNGSFIYKPRIDKSFANTSPRWWVYFTFHL